MKTIIKLKSFAVLPLMTVMFGAYTPSAHATVLVFKDFFTNPEKTARAWNSTFSGEYGDNVTNFDPATPLSSGQYVSYGSAGGTTPNITLTIGDFRVSDNLLDLNVSNSLREAGNATYVMGLRDSTVSGWGKAIIFTPDASSSVQISSFDTSNFGGSLANAHVTIVQDAFGVSPVVLWDSGLFTMTGGDGGPSGGFNSFTSNVTGAMGASVSLLWSAPLDNGLNSTVSNVQFSQVTVPEPGVLGLASIGTISLLGLARRRRSAVLAA